MRPLLDHVVITGTAPHWLLEPRRILSSLAVKGQGQNGAPGTPYKTEKFSCI
jgi:hypothetical protein